MKAKEEFGIVGGGMLGMTLALRLVQQGFNVSLFEAAAHLGGLADAWQVGDLTWDRHYHVTLLSDSHLHGLLKELDLDGEMRWVTTRTGFYCDGRHHPFSSSLDFLRFPPLGLIDKARLAWTIQHASRFKDSTQLEQIPVANWLRRHSGTRTFERIWLPLLKAKLGDAWQRTSAAFIWATIQRLYAARRSGLKREMFGYLPGGYARMIETLRCKLESLGVQIVTGWRAESIERADGGQLALRSIESEEQHFDRIVVTTAAPLAARLCPQLSVGERERLEGIEYLGIVCASLVLKKPLNGYYVTNITDETPFTGVIEMTALVDPAEFGGQTLVYLPKYVAPHDPLFEQSDDAMKAAFWAALRRMYPQLVDDDLLAFRVSRVREVFALSTLGYSTRVPSVATSVPALFLVNSSQIVNGSLNVNETLRLAEASLPTLTQPLPPADVSHVQTHRELVARSG